MQQTLTSPRIAYARVGERGPDVLLVMGLGMRGEIWRPQLDRLGGDHRVVYFDNRGIGQSEALRGFPTVRDFARDALRVADAAGLERFHLVGVSLGGMISQELTLAAPERVRSLTLLATHAGGPMGLVPTARGLGYFVRAFGLRGAARIEAMQRILYTPRFLDRVDRKVLAERIAAQAGDPPKQRTTVGQLLAVARHDTRARLRDVRVPTLVLKPADDVLVRPEHSHTLARGIPNARMHTVYDAGHGLMFQNADEVAEAIRGHIAQCEGRGA